MDFIRVMYKESKEGTREFYPDFLVLKSNDLVIRGGQFVAIWDEDTQLYCRHIYEAADIIDRAFSKMIADKVRSGDVVRKTRVFGNGLFSKFLAYVRSLNDVGPDLDQVIIFANQTPSKKDAATFKMSYALDEGPCPAWNALLDVLYPPHERFKIEWAIGSIFSGEAATKIQKMYVFFGPPGSGKGTIMNIIEMLFEGHTTSFSAYDLGRGDSQFSMEPFAKNPLVAIDQDGDLSRIDTNKNLNMLVAHDKIVVNSKGKNLFTIKPRATLFVGSNEPVKISDRKAGLFRRLVDIQPTGVLVEESQYHELMGQIRFELGAIASQCTKVYTTHGPSYLSEYRSHDMMYRTNDIFNFVEDNRLILSHGVTLKQAHKMYIEWCADTDTKSVFKQYRFRDLLRDYFDEFHDQIMIDGQRYRSYFRGLKELEEFKWVSVKPEQRSWLQLESQDSLLDDVLADQKAQLYTGQPEHPLKHSWTLCSTTLANINTRLEHFVMVPTQHIVIDFDLRDSLGEKNLELNVKAAREWPPTYSEVSRSGQGLHLHYNYTGDVEQLASIARDGTYEIKTLLGNSSLRRKLSKCNRLPIATLSGGLPLREEKKVLSHKAYMTDKGLRELLVRAMRKEIHPHTKPSMDFIKKVLDDMVAQGTPFDVNDMYDDIAAFALASTNQYDACLDILSKCKFNSEEIIEAEPDASSDDAAPIVIFDCEVYPNFFAIGWMHDRDDATVVKMINPTPQEVEELFAYRLIGFNNRSYDNHILYARTLGYTNEALYDLSQRIIVHNDTNAKFAAAYNLSYCDVYDYASVKQSLKKWQVELGIPHKELDIPWDQPVPEDRVMDVLDYLENDVRATRAVHHARSGDFAARQILAELSGLEVCHTTRQHTERLIFGEVKDPSSDLVYTDLSKMFVGYTFDQYKPGKEKSTYRGESVGEGGYVYAEPGMYTNVALLDVASMHPTSIVELDLFGKYTKNFKELMDTRLLIKAKNLSEAAKKFNGRLAAYVGNMDEAKQLSDALKIVINTVYGLTAATFPNKFRDPRNIDNIVAKRGALFMIDLKHFIQERGFTVVHIKTDSVKIPNATPEIIAEVIEFGAKYGYTFEHEGTYEKFCLVNDAVYVARKDGVWEATGAQFQHPAVFKALFTNEEPHISDYIEVKQVQKGAMYLVDPHEETMTFVGRFGAFIPIINGRALMRRDGEKVGAVVGTKGYQWELAEVAISQKYDIDMSYFRELIDEAKATIEKFGSFSEFVAA